MMTLLKKYYYIAAAYFVAAMLLLNGCSKKQNSNITLETKNRAEIPGLEADTISSIITESGNIKFRISAGKYFIYDKAEEPYWDFPNGAKFERFSDSLKIDSEISCKKATYLEKKQLWELRNRVVAKNIKGEIFETELLYWDEKKETVYTEELIRITRENEIITGKNFTSNQDFSKYEIKNTQAVFQIQLED